MMPAQAARGAARAGIPIARAGCYVHAMRRSRMRLGLAAAGIAVAAACATGSGTMAAAGPEPRVAVVLDVGGCPDTDTLELCEGIRRAMRRTGVKARIVSPTFRESLADFLALIAQQRYDAVVLFGLYYDPQVSAVARRNPKVPFIVMDAPRTDVPNAAPNVEGEVLQAREAAFLAGWLAAKLEQRRPGPDVIGAVAGVRGVPGVETFLDGFVAGATRAAPRIKVLVDYSDDWVDQGKCAALARRQIARGAGTVFNVAGACGLGVIQAAADADIWAIGVDSDQSFLGPHVLTSVLKSFEAGFVDVFNRVKTGKLHMGRDTTLTMRDGAAGLGRISPRVPRTLVTRVRQLERQIVTGKLRVLAPRSGK
jgi:basic membrane protein A